MAELLKHTDARVEDVSATELDSAIMRVRSAEEAEEEEEGRLLVVSFGAPWCGPCQRYKPEFALGALTAAAPGRKFVQLDCERYKSKCHGLGVPHYPFIIAFIGGQMHRSDALEPLDMTHWLSQFDRNSPNGEGGDEDSNYYGDVADEESEGGDPYGYDPYAHQQDHYEYMHGEL
eukprot:UC1_evm1s880